MPADVYRLSDYRDEWREIFYRDDGYTELHIFVNRRTGELEIFQMADGQGRRSCLSTVDSAALTETLKVVIDRVAKGEAIG
jgi:hypothetical protein